MRVEYQVITESNEVVDLFSFDHKTRVAGNEKCAIAPFRKLWIFFIFPALRFILAYAELA